MIILSARASLARGLTRASLFCLLLIPSLCFGVEALHDPTQPAILSDSQQVAPMDIANANVNKMILDGILISPFRKIAVVNGIAFQVGDMESGIKMLSITENAVRILKNQQEIELAFPVLDQNAIEIKRKP